MALLRGSSRLWCLARSFNTALVMSLKASRSYCSSVTSAKVEVNGVLMHYELTGQGNHAILLIPGAMGSAATDFELHLKTVNKELFTVVAWDPRGQGRSIPPCRDYPPDFFERDAKDAVDLMQALKFKRFSVMGWSAGGTTALIAAGKYPDLIRKVVVSGAFSYVMNEDMKLFNILLDFSQLSDRLRKIRLKLYDTEYLSKCFNEFVKQMACFPKTDNGNVCRHILPLIQCPTLIIHGQEDNLVRPYHAEFIHKQIKGSQLYMMQEGSHSLHMRFAEEFNRVVEDFLK